MAFLDVGSTEKKERFSLLLLDPGEIYFEDFSAYYYPPGLSEEEAIKRRQKGWLKICSKSLVFDPKDVHFPILKLTFSNVTKMDKWIGPLFSRVDVKNKMIMVETSQSIQMKANNQITPYVFIREQERHLFCLNFAKVDDCLPQMCQLQRASTLPSADQITMINAIVAGRQLRVNFDTSWLDDLYEKIVMETQGDRITPLVTNPGRIMLTSSRLYFQPFNNVDPLPVLKIKIADIRRIIKRRFLLRHVKDEVELLYTSVWGKGIEIFNENNTQCPHLYLTLKSEDARNTLYDAIIKQPGIKLEDSNTENVTLKWQNRIISNYEYLSYLNSMSDRSTNDLTQYPVFPWVIADYSSGTLDLQNPETYRDLSKPIGALNEERLQRLLERYNEMPEPRFLYGSHYSTPGFVLFYLARVAPEYMLCLQNGRFDHPDRMFNSLQDAWKNCQESFSDFKELIPEFYDSTGTFLTNNPLVNFGVKFDGKPVLSVELPPWATDSVDFINKLRAALESEYVSQNIHHWIDLIFGYKQRGEESEKAHNVFYYLTYEGAIDLESIDDPNQRSALEAQIMEFGQTPKQLFTSPHPPRGRLSPENCPLVNPAYQQPQTADKLDRENNTIETPEDHQDSCTAQTKCYWSNMDKLQSFAEHKLHKEQISDVRWGPNKKTVYSVSQDTLLKVYSLEEKLQLRSIQLSNMALSCCLIPDDKTILAGCWDNNIYIYSFEFGRIIDCIYAHDDAISHMCLEKNLLVSSSWDSTVKLWNFSEGSKGFHVEYKGEFDHEAGVTSLCMHTDGTSIATGTRDGQVITWDSSTNVPLLQLQGHTGTVTSASYSQDGKRLMTCGEDQYLKVTDISTGTQVYTKDTGHNLKCAVWDGKTVIAGTSDGQLLMWDLVAVKLVKKIHSHQGAVTCLNASQDGNLLSGGEDRVVKAWHSFR